MFYYERMSMAQWLTLKSSTLLVRDRFSGGQSIYLLFNSDIENFLLKTNGGKTEDLILLFL